MQTTSTSEYDVVIRNGTIYDGGGSAPYVGDVAIQGDTIAAMGQLHDARGRSDIDARGLAVAPGFINVMSHAEQTLIADGRSQSDIRQGVTLEVLGESWVGPLDDTLKKEWTERQGDIKFEIEWSTLGEYLAWLVKRGISPNVASFVPLLTIRPHVLGYANRAPTARELDQMRALVRQAMEEGALGLATALIYPPDCYSETAELIALAQVAAEYGGMYISHIRSERNRLLEAIDELITIARRAGLAAEIYHLKAAGQSNWHQMDAAIEKVEAARAEGLLITADMYTYTAGSTGLSAILPPWMHEGGHRALIERLKNPALRERAKQEMAANGDEWENLYLAAGSAEKVLLVSFKHDALKPLTGKTLAQVAAMRGQEPVDTAMDLIVEDDSRIGTIYFMMSEDNIRKQIALPWLSFGSDSGSLAPDGVFLKSSPHPRAYGNFARLLGKYVREEKIIPLEEAIRRLTSFPAANLKLDRRGSLREGYFADLVVFDPNTIQDHATYQNPHQYATGVVHVFVNGVQVLKDGEHTGAKPGRVVHGPGWKQQRI